MTQLMIRRRPPESQELVADIAETYLGRYPFVRDAANAILYKLQTGKPVDYTLTPAEQAGKSFVAAGQDVVDLFTKKRLKDDFISDLLVDSAEAVAMMAGIRNQKILPWGGIPTKQMITFMKGTTDLQTGRSKTPLSLIDRGAEKKRRENLKKKR